MIDKLISRIRNQSGDKAIKALAVNDVIANVDFFLNELKLPAEHVAYLKQRYWYSLVQLHADYEISDKNNHAEAAILAVAIESIREEVAVSSEQPIQKAEIKNEIRQPIQKRTKKNEFRLDGNVLWIAGKAETLTPGARELWAMWKDSNGKPIAHADLPHLQFSKIISTMSPRAQKLIKKGSPHHGPSVPGLQKGKWIFSLRETKDI